MASLSPIAAPQIIYTANDEAWQRSIVARAVSIGVGMAQQFGFECLQLALQVLDITPPASGKANRAAFEAGKGAIRRDVWLMGIEPVEIKGHREISHVPAGNVKGRPAVAISPVTVPTKLNPKFADPDSFHKARLLAASKPGRRGRASRGGTQAFYADARKVNKMLTRLYGKIGELAAAWLPLIRKLNNGDLPARVPAWIKRHEAWGAAHTTFDANLDPAKDRLFIYAVNHVPETADPNMIADTQRRVEAAKDYRVGAMTRAIEGRAKRIAAGG